MRSKVRFQNCLTQQNLFSLTALQLYIAIYARYAVSKMLERKEGRRKEWREGGNKESGKEKEEKEKEQEIKKLGQGERG